jgi:hypothetical protein
LLGDSRSGSLLDLVSARRNSSGPTLSSNTPAQRIRPRVTFAPTPTTPSLPGASPVEPPPSPFTDIEATTATSTTAELSSTRATAESDASTTPLSSRQSSQPAHPFTCHAYHSSYKKQSAYMELLGPTTFTARRPSPSFSTIFSPTSQPLTTFNSRPWCWTVPVSLLPPLPLNGTLDVIGRAFSRARMPLAYVCALSGFVESDGTVPQ